MGFNFSFFGKQEVRKFNYIPRFYDPEAEERRKKYGDFTKKAEGYTPGKHVKGHFRDGNYLLFPTQWHITHTLEHNEGLKLEEYGDTKED